MTNGSDERMAVTAAGASLVAALTLVPLIKGPTWFFAAAVMVLTVMVSGIVGRQLARGWWPAVVGLQAVLLFLAIVVLFARSELVNPPGAVRMLADLVRTGLDVTQSQSPPVESARGIVLLAAGGTGLVALAVDILATSFRQPALAGLPLLAMYCVPAALLDDGLPWYLFLVSAAGFLLLLSADAGDRVRAWGRVLASAGQRSAVRPGGDTGLARGGRRVALAAVAVAVVVPALVPGLNNQILGGSGDGDGSGGSVITRINPILDMRRDLNDPVDTQLLAYTTSVADPDPLRIVTDDEYDGKTWEPSNKNIPRSQTIQSGMPPVPGLTGAVSTTKQTADIQIYRMRQTYLPLPYPSTKVSGLSGEWLYDSETLNVIGNGATTLQAHYTTNFLQITPTVQQLSDAPAAPDGIVKKYTALPKNMPSKILQVAKQEAGNGSKYEQAVRLQDYFRSNGGFTYDTQAPSSTDDGDGSYQAIVDFLNAREGYCVHFASTMAVMARALGIPARVAVGFLPGSVQTDNKRIISSHDAHAWPELYFGGVGWVRLEPTPRSGTVEPEWTQPQSTTGDSSSGNDTSTTTTPDTSQDSASSSAEANVPDEEEAAAAGQSSGGFHLPWQPVVLLLVVLIALASPRLAASMATRRRWRGATTVPGLAAAAWDDLRLGLSDLGVRWAASWTPRAVRQRLNDDYQLNPDQSAALDRLVEELEEAFYAPPSDAHGRSAAERRHDGALVVGAVAVQKSSQTRWRARLWPTSGLSALSGLGTWVTAKFQRAQASDSEDGGKPREKTGSGVH
jgi:transglutaminase-like putative cysteine protease